MFQKGVSLKETNRIEKALEILELDYKKGPSYFSLHCPFARVRTAHKGADRKPSFVIFPQYNIARCYSCGLFFSIMDFVEEYARFTSNTSDFEFLEFYIPTMQQEELENIVLDESILNSFEESDRVEEYLASRGISQKTLKFFYDSKNFRVVLPIRDEYNHLVGATGRSTTQNPMKVYHYFGVKTTKCLCGLEHQDANANIVVEGLMDMASAYDKIEKLNLSYNVVSTLTCSMSEWQAKKLIDMDKPIFMAFDIDDPGRKGQLKSLKLLDSLGADILVNVNWKGPKDIGDMNIKLFEQLFS